ncbi:BAG family molecular chaperone regulator 8, chloroplastic [Trifolium pratense]|uniref:BAG family molecular chaperone regulator 8, chloroplastic n=1 Tax=Trifolium pratense TaxID=57577 RepID=UPI001E6927D7|nr:BAG family molecular chaperone regulator 8, chloroplastic [Trifolium pratense]
MASHHHYNHHHHSHHQPPPPPPPPPPTHCCCTPSYTCCTPQQHDHLVHIISSLILSQQHDHLVHNNNNNLNPTQFHHHPKSQTLYHHNQNQNHNLKHQSITISSLLNRIESLESSLNHQSYSLRHSAARVIQTHFRSFLVRRSRTLRNLKQLASIKSSFISIRSSFSTHTHFDFPALSLKAVNLLIQLDSIQDRDTTIVDGKRLISRDLVQFLDSIEEVAAKKRIHYVKAVKSSRTGQKVQRPRNSDGDDAEKKKLLKNLRGRVEKISKLCEAYGDDEEGLEAEDGVHNHGDDYDDDDGVTDVLIGRRDRNKNGVFVKRQEIQPRVKKSVRFAENGNVCEVYSTRTCESDGSSSNDDRGEVLENRKFVVVDVVDSSQGVDDDEEALVEDSGGSTRSRDDGDIVKEQHQEKLLFSAPLPLKMENRTDLKSKGVKILS